MKTALEERSTCRYADRAAAFIVGVIEEDIEASLEGKKVVGGL